MNYNYCVDITSMFFIIFMVGTILSSIFDSILEWMNTRKGNIKKRLLKVQKIHPLMRKYFSYSKVRTAMEYNGEHEKFSNLSDAIHSPISAMVCLFGLAPFYMNFLITSFPGLPTTIHYIIFVISIEFLKMGLSIPFSIYSIFHIENKYGFNNMNGHMFMTDTIKSFLMSVITTSIFITIINEILTRFGPFSQLNVCAFVFFMILLGMVFEYIYMTVIIRIFNKLTPLKDKKLKSKIESLLKKYGYEKCKVFVMDASKRSNKSNAFIGGFGRSKKIVLFDTLLKNYTHDELIAILGHELAHGKLHHLITNRIISAITSLISVYVIFLLAYDINLYHTFGFRFVDETNIIKYSFIGFGLASMVVTSVRWIFNPVFAWFSRKCEYAADKYSVIYTGKRNAAISALIKLSSDNCADLFPDKTYECMTYGHPSLLNRISAIKNVKINKKNS